jgi:hypothetical protein
MITKEEEEEDIEAATNEQYSELMLLTPSFFLSFSYCLLMK